jgi:hypothetical protein
MENLREGYDQMHYFDGFYQWDLIKYNSVIWQSLVILLCPFLLYSVVWYERHSADIRYRTIINQLLSRLCFIDILACLIAQSSYLIILACGPFHVNYCDFTVLVGRFFYFVCISIIVARQIIRYLYIFKWKHVACLNDDFLAAFITLYLVAFGFVFSMTTFILGYHNEDLDFHICTGNNPSMNINLTLKVMSHPANETFQPVWFQPDQMSDPIDYFSTFMLFVLLCISFKTWALSHNTNIIKFFKDCLKNFKLSKIAVQNLSEPKTESNSKFENSKITIIGDGSSLITNILTFVALVVLAIGKDFGIKNYDNANQVFHF